MAEAEKREGKLLHASKLIVNRDGENVQYSKESEFNGIKTLYYYHKLEFDNGDEGTARSKKPEGNFTEGHRYSYDKREFTNDKGYTNQSFSGLKDLDKPAFQGSGGYKKMSPEEQKHILNQVAMISVENLMVAFPDITFMDWYSPFREWLYTKVFTQSENSQSVSGIIKIATDYYARCNDENVTLEKVLKFADRLLKLSNDTTWENEPKNQSQTSSQTSSQSEPKQNQNPQPKPQSPTPSQSEKMVIGNQETQNPPDSLTEDDLPF